MISFLKSFSSNIHYKYSVQSSPQFSTGCWSVFDAKNKSTNEPVSVFVLSKKTISKIMSQNGVELRSAMWEEIKEFATQGVQQLTKIRHPSVVRIVEPLEAGKGTLTFVTERLVSTVKELHESDLDELSVVRGITSVVQALNFLHTSIGMVHLNVTPETIIVDAQGDWKLTGFEFLTKYEDHSPGSYHLPQRDGRLPAFMHPAYDYLAPELVLQKTAVPANDVWGIAAVLYALYLRRSPLKTRGNPNAYREEYSMFRSRLPTLSSKFPVKLRPYLESLFSHEYEGRITLEILETTDFFQNPLIKALKGIDEYAAKPLEEKVSFLKHLQGLLQSFPKQMRLRKIVKFAATELQGPREPATGLLMGNTLFSAANDMSSLSFSDQVLPLFSSLTDYMPFQESVATNVDVVARVTSDKDFSKSILPLFVDALKHHDAQHVGLQTQILKKTHVYAKNLTIPKMEQALFPTVIDCFAATPARIVKVAATESLSVLVDRGVSKALIADRLIPALQAMKTRDPNVVIAVAELWKTLCPRLNSQQVFTLALPHLLDLAMAKEFTVDQFKQIMAIIQEQIDSVKKNQMKVLVNNHPQDPDDWLNDSGVSNTIGSSTTTATATTGNTRDSGNSQDTSDSASSSSINFDPLANTIAPPDLLDAQPSFGSTHTPKQLKKPEPLPKVPPILPAPNKAAPKITPRVSSLNAPSVQMLQLTSRSASNPTPSVSNSNTFASPMMAPLVPSNKTAANNNTTSTFLPVLQPMQPKTKPKPVIPNSTSEDDFGDFTSSKQVDSLI